ncbi:MAG: fibronectin type III domain-containing protein [Chloroflexi bacterium]|nr:fibronectin type III domain-containing protein [Chloroflexota bacterium]
MKPRFGLVLIVGIVLLFALLSSPRLESAAVTPTPARPEKLVTPQAPSVVEKATRESRPSIEVPANSELLDVPFTGGVNATTTVNKYTGVVTIQVSGSGQAAGTQLSDAFYLYDPPPPRTADGYYDFTLMINGAHAEDLIGSRPAYDSSHVYTFQIQGNGQALSFGVGDAMTGDNSGKYVVAVSGDTIPGGIVQVPALVLAYFPPDPANPEYLDPAETGWSNQKIVDMQNATRGMVAAGADLISDATRYHGYKDAAAPRYLEYVVQEYREFFEPLPRGYPLGNLPAPRYFGELSPEASTASPAMPNTAYRPHYGNILRDMGICNYVDGQGVKEVWIYGYHSSVIVPDESKMSSKYGDVSNAYPKDEAIPAEYRLPRCANSYVMYNFTYQPGGSSAIGNTVHNRLHQIENVIFFAEKRGYPPNDQNAVGSLFWDDFSVYGAAALRPGYCASCGNTHSPPNTTQGYDYASQTYAENNCETWNPDDGQTTYVNANCSQWGCTDVSFYKWFMQNIPGYENGIMFQGRKLRNWWEAMYDFNAFIDARWSLYEACSIAPDKPALLKPKDKAKVGKRQVALDWNDVACADNYKIIVKDAVTGKKVESKTVFASNHKTKALTAGRTYKWQVKACNALGCSAAARTFTIKAGATFEWERDDWFVVNEKQTAFAGK